MTLNFHAGWVGLLLGCLSGAVPGLFFFNETWLGGYASWRRRMIRLAHISFFGLGFINLFAALSVRSLGCQDGWCPASLLLLVGAATMPTVCYLSAWRPVFRHLFFIPAGSVTVGIGLMLWRLMPA